MVWIVFPASAYFGITGTGGNLQPTTQLVCYGLFTKYPTLSLPVLFRGLRKIHSNFADIGKAGSVVRHPIPGEYYDAIHRTGQGQLEFDGRVGDSRPMKDIVKEAHKSLGSHEWLTCGESSWSVPKRD